MVVDDSQMQGTEIILQRVVNVWGPSGVVGRIGCSTNRGQRLGKYAP
jgi:hypothetical protein